MKKIALYSALGLATLLASCDAKENVFEVAQIAYPTGVSVLYADQSLDSINFVTTFDWSLSTASDWMHIDANNQSGSVPKGYMDARRVNIQIDANQTGESRYGTVLVNFNGQAVGGRYYQLHYLNVRYPKGTEDGQFVLQDSAMQVRDSLVFQTYGDNWTLAFKGDAPTWMRLEDDAVTTGRAGKYVVYYKLDKNETEAERSAVFELNSRGVVTEIKVNQQTKKKK